ncbi:MAG: hypothetical protein IKR57_06335 [Bacilli bacterium]|nr:hypothetical protein [Bacilli bacterium]
MDNIEKNIKEFVSQLVENKNARSIKSALICYKEFLINTKMIRPSDEITIWLNKVIENAELIQILKDKNGSINLDLFLKSINIITFDEQEIDQKHYGHYDVQPVIINLQKRFRTISSSCGSESTSDSC